MLTFLNVNVAFEHFDWTNVYPSEGKLQKSTKQYKPSCQHENLTAYRLQKPNMENKKMSYLVFFFNMI